MSRREQLNESIKLELSELVPFIHGEVSNPEIKGENHRTHLDDIGYPGIRGKYHNRSVCILFSTDSPTYEARMGKNAFLHPVMQIILFIDLSIQFSVVPHRTSSFAGILQKCGIRSHKADFDLPAMGKSFDLKSAEDRIRLRSLLTASGFQSEMSTLSSFIALKAEKNLLKLEIRIEQSNDFHNLQLQRAIESLHRLARMLTSVEQGMQQEELHNETPL
ncbi:MAG: hypothetical protein KAH54_03865 [Candidatus Sabulitectum sp.]|nr:hypothetical protein [Candidatus Sabulitectum sp.]